MRFSKYQSAKVRSLFGKKKKSLEAVQDFAIRI